MDQYEDREEGAPPSKTTNRTPLGPGPDRLPKAQRHGPGPGPGPSCVSVNSDDSMGVPQTQAEQQSSEVPSGLQDQTQLDSTFEETQKASLKESLLKILKHLIHDEFKEFKWFLTIEELPIPVSRLENAERTDTVDLMVQTYYTDTQRVAVRVLEKMNRTDLVKKLSKDIPVSKVTGGGGLGERKGQQSVSQAELERQQILNEMKKKTLLLTDSSWICQRSTNTITSKEADIPPMRRGESLDNLDSSYNSWRSSWTPRSSSYCQNYSRPHSALSGSTSFHGGWSGARHSSSTLPSSSSMGSLRGGAGTPSSPWSRQTPSPSPSSPSPTTSPEPRSDPPQQQSRSVSGKKICTFCDTPLGKGAAMIVESLGLSYHLSCFKCIDCKSDLGGSEAGAEIRIRNKQLYCNSCYMRFKTGQPTAK
ncbi:LIM domain only protein 7-like isoform X1 [Sphaeramia orbicularis]|uniref:LIM domain only protein 7-like isoform X1 n=1 Tax=Sphaeramia orbicularis TaxID=375764 RepID=UPI00117D3E17|nr:LIM domain only protein 7-like isoform X1 [Sphaeramia orbicularis]XP_030011490.1 LIM domain only protein 7-like isoform X1 [Sphaeramia orbicularis]XP_030011498.1 LIM domain only protein 7-like isoform X1 [Sphaeramia orbicularis]